MAKKEKRVVKTKEEIIKELRGNKKFAEKMAFAKDKFYPALMKSSKSIDDATMFLSSISTVMMEKFLGIMKERKMSDLKLIDALDSKDEKYEDIKFLLELFEDMTVFDARDYIEGMKNEVNLFIQEENRVRPLSDLKTRWLGDMVEGR